MNKGDIILIHTVAGGLGLLFTAYAKSRGATVIGTTSTPEKAEIAKSYGADYVILYPKENTVQRVLELTNGEGVHAVFDGVGKDTYVPVYFPQQNAHIFGIQFHGQFRFSTEERYARQRRKRIGTGGTYCAS